MASIPPVFAASVSAWLNSSKTVRSAVLFGSTARSERAAAIADSWSDMDLHLIAREPRNLEIMDWGAAFPEMEFCLQVTRPATGGVRKITAIFSGGQIDVVVIPSRQMSFAAFAMHLGYHRRLQFLWSALNEMATCLHTGYHFLKGEPQWGDFYSRVAALPGVRLADSEICTMADIFICELIWILQKIQRGEIVAAQHMLHTKLCDTNLRLWRELQRRRDLPLPSFGLGRRLETLATAAEYELLRVACNAEQSSLTKSAWQCFDGLKALMRCLVPGWSIPVKTEKLLQSHRPTPAR